MNFIKSVCLVGGLALALLGPDFLSFCRGLLLLSLCAFLIYETD
jgi:hypothetical protein